MATTTASTKTIIRTSSWLVALALFGAALAVFSFVDLTGREAPLAKLNGQIVEDLAGAGALPVGPRLELLGRLREEQEKALAGKPSEPFAWARLSYLRYATEGDMPDAFAALRLSDFISPDEPRQLPERAMMWRQFDSVENNDEKAYQAELWRKAFRMQPDKTWAIAAKNGIVFDVGDALKGGEPYLYQEWKRREDQNP